MRATVPGLAARRSCRAHAARISSFHGMSGLISMLELSRPPHGDHRSENSSPTESVRVARICVAFEHDQRGCAGRMCCREQRRRRECAVDREENRFSAPEIVKHRGDAVGPLLQGRQRARRDGIGRSRARLVEEDEPTERCHRLDPPLKGRQLREDLTVCEPVRDEHDVARTFMRRAIGDAQVPVQRIARLREHCGSVSRGAGRVSVSCDQLKQSVLRVFGVTGCTSAYGRRNEFRRNPPLCRGDGEEMPFAGHALELVSAALLELEP